MTRYPPPIAELLREERLPPLGPGSPNLAARPQLEALRCDASLRAGLWLYHDFLDESHQISQGLPTPTGSFWHGIMHRREPDYGNARYWFRRVGKHPIFDELAQRAAELAGREQLAPAASFLVVQASWNPFDFIDLVEATAAGSTPHEQLCRQIQLLEWRLLFEHAFEETRQ